MQQCRLTLVPAMFALVFVAGSTSNAHAANCIAKPNGQPAQGQHWYYRTDRVTNRQCWYLGPENADVQKGATVAPKQQSNSRTLRAAPPHAQRPTATAPEAAHAAIAAEANVPAPAAPVRRPEAAKLPDVPPSFEPAPQLALAEAPRSTGAIDPAPAPATNDAEEPQSPVNAQTSPAAAQAAVEAPSSLVVIALALLAMFGPVFYTARWLRRRKARDRQGLGPSTVETSYLRAWTSPDSVSETAARHVPPPKPLEQAEKEVALALRQLLDDMQTKQSAKSLDQTEQLAQELQQLLNKAQTKQYAKPLDQTEQLTQALNIVRDRVSDRVEIYHGQPTSATDGPLRSRDLLLANLRN
jgi:hypothetical protein